MLFLYIVSQWDAYPVSLLLAAESFSTKERSIYKDPSHVVDKNFKLKELHRLTFWIALAL